MIFIQRNGLRVAVDPTAIEMVSELAQTPVAPTELFVHGASVVIRDAFDEVVRLVPRFK